MQMGTIGVWEPMQMIIWRRLGPAVMEEEAVLMEVKEKERLRTIKPDLFGTNADVMELVIEPMVNLRMAAKQIFLFWLIIFQKPILDII